MARPRKTIPSEEQKLHIPIDVLADVRLLLYDPLRQRTRTGAISELVTELLRAWVAKQREGLVKVYISGDNNIVAPIPSNPGDPDV